MPAVLTGGRDLLTLLGSGSRPQRERAFAVELHPDGEVAAAAMEVSAAGFYAPLSDYFDEPNLEAGYVDGVHVHVFQRANRGRSLNSRLTYDAGKRARGCAGAPHNFDRLLFSSFRLAVTTASRSE
ncbi:hypothetical protein EZ313_03200 [Ramlibacter henchirensis]|uniref:Uncharacterized protein n=1 Tax=Ramlibacter henchirensis TaxID=204072 RepID=A0A4Z0C2D7_9BURK|nr:hypothetical protein [Ramlibacter henchirensis]TFZ05683.1 hypothetical protein EZ313_03200 [Ramlibacter henchirensis]